MTPSQQAKEAGLKNLLQVQQLTGQSAQTLTNWHRDKPELFKIVLLGCVSSLESENLKRLRVAINQFCRASEWAADGWKQQPHIRELFCIDSESIKN